MRLQRDVQAEERHPCQRTPASIATTEALRQARCEDVREAKSLLMIRFGVMAVALFALLTGGVFALQGLRVLPSQVMYGDSKWVAIGLALVFGSLFVLWRGRPRRSRVKEKELTEH